MSVDLNIYSYNWGHELRALEEDRKARFPDREVYSSPENASTPVDNIIAVAKAARGQPEIWKMVNWSIENVDMNFDDERRATNFFGRFESWYRLKNNLMEDDGIAYLAAYGLVTQWAMGNLDEDNDEDSRNYIIKNRIGRIRELV